LPEKQHKKNERFKYVILPKKPLVGGLKNKKEKKYSIEYLIGVMKKTRKVLLPYVLFAM